jgi:phage replication O-like protein O
MDFLAAYRLPGEQMQCLLFVLRKTYGFNKKTDKISLSQFVNGTGINRPNVARAIKGLIDKNIIHVKKGGIKKDTIKVSEYRFNKRYDTWKSSIKKDTGGIKKDKKVVSKKIHTKDNIQKKVYSDKSKAFVGNFISYIKNIHPNQAPKTKNLEENSLEEIDKLVRLDGFDLEYIRKVIGWAVKDEFWSNQVFSLAGLRIKKTSGLTKFQNISAAYEKEHKEPEQIERVPVFRVVNDD